MNVSGENRRARVARMNEMGASAVMAVLNIGVRTVGGGIAPATRTTLHGLQHGVTHVRGGGVVGPSLPRGPEPL